MEYVCEDCGYTNKVGKDNDLNVCEKCGKTKIVNGRKEIIQGETVHAKTLRKFWEHPIWGKYMKPENCIIVDDRKSIAIANPDNLIQLPMYDPSLNSTGIGKEDDTFTRLMDFFKQEKVKNCKDIRKIDKQVFSLDEVRQDDQ